MISVGRLDGILSIPNNCNSGSEFSAMENEKNNFIIVNPNESFCEGENILSPKLSRNNIKFHKIFNIAEEERLIKSFPCALVAEIFFQGTFYSSANHFCFHSRIATAKHKAIKLCLKDVTKISREKTAGIFPNAISIQTKENKFVFSSIISRDSVYKHLSTIWKDYLHFSNIHDATKKLENNEDFQNNLQCQVLQHDDKLYNSSGENSFNVLSPIDADSTLQFSMPNNAIINEYMNSNPEMRSNSRTNSTNLLLCFAILSGLLCFTGAAIFLWKLHNTHHTLNFTVHQLLKQSLHVHIDESGASSARLYVLRESHHRIQIEQLRQTLHVNFAILKHLKAYLKSSLFQMDNLNRNTKIPRFAFAKKTMDRGKLSSSLSFDL